MFVMDKDFRRADNHSMLTIAQVERETGLSKDVLRVWERRYGFPAPQRTEGGDRLYDIEQVGRLRLIKRLIDQGFRPGRLLSLSAEDLEALGRNPLPPKMPPASGIQQVLERLAADDNLGLRLVLTQLLARQGLHHFVREMAPLLNDAVGDGWASGRLGVYQEHLYTEEFSRLLRAAIGSLPAVAAPPRILLTTLSGEAHGLGLLMAESLLTAEGAQCISLGLQTPMEDIFKAVPRYRIQILALSFSVVFPSRTGLSALRLLRTRLPADVEIWAGGSMTRALAKHELPGIFWMPELSDGLAGLAEWRERHG